jgi:NAD(P)-dependent dehydrogenase (short-subunit alcohol dehydrogenase family)
MRGRTVVVTGANSGIGKAMAVELARRGARVALVCRNRERGMAAQSEVDAAATEDASELHIADLSAMDDVRRVADELGDRFDRIDVLANNAGLYLPKRHVTPDGFETMYAVNHLAPFLLTRMLAEPLAAAGQARVVTTSSGAHRFAQLDLDDLQCERSFLGMRQYGNTKLMNILFTRELARRWADRGVRANCFHPGTVATGFAQDEPGLLGFLVKIGTPFLRTPEKGAATGIQLAADASMSDVSGQYFIDGKAIPPTRAGRDDAAAARLWALSEQHAGLA